MLLCGSAMGAPAAQRNSERVQAAFALFDEDGDGCISVEEMERFLAAIFGHF